MNKDKMLKLATALLVLVALVSLCVMGWQLYIYQAGKKAYQELEQNYTRPAALPEQEKAPEIVVEPTRDDSEKLRDFTLMEVDFEALRRQNDDVAGWICFDSVAVSYPVLYSGDNETYLRHLMDGRYSTGGSIFREAENGDWGELHTILYGHNMRNGTMFAPLLQYRDKAFFEQNGGWFTLYTPNEGNWRYQLFGIKQVDPYDPVYTVDHTEGEDYVRFLQQMCADCLYDTGVKLYDDDRVMTLSTCTADGQNRIVLFARRAGQILQP